VLHKSSGGAALPVPYSGFAGATVWLHQGPGPTDMKCRTFAVRNGEQGDRLLLYGQLQESPRCEAQAPGGAHSVGLLGYAEWAARVGPLVARVPGADERLGHHATWTTF
jgi:hypothetical protein